MAIKATETGSLSLHSQFNFTTILQITTTVNSTTMVCLKAAAIFLVAITALVQGENQVTNNGKLSSWQLQFLQPCSTVIIIEIVIIATLCRVCL